MPIYRTGNSLFFYSSFFILIVTFVLRTNKPWENMPSTSKLNQLYFKDTQFANLMTRRIFNVLLIANPYDAFMLEDDGRIDEKIFN